MPYDKRAVKRALCVVHRQPSYAVKLVLQGTVTCGLVGWILRDQELDRQLLSTVSHANWWWLFAAAAVYGLVEILGAVRWHLLLRHFKFDLHWTEATRLLLLAIFFNTLLPGLIAGDALRAVYLRRRFPDLKTGAVLVVVYERILGLGGLIALSASTMWLRAEWLHRSAASGHLADLALACLAIGGATAILSLVAAQCRSGKRWFTRNEFRSSDANSSAWNVSSLAVVLGSTLLAHLCYGVSFYCTARALSPSHAPSILDMLTLTPIVNTFTSLPISLSGIGVRESLLQVLLHDLCGLPGAVGVLVGSLGFAIRALWAIAGILVLACCHRLNWNECIGHLAIEVRKKHRFAMQPQNTRPVTALQRT